MVGYNNTVLFIFVILQQMIEEEEEQFATGEFFNCNCCKFFAVFKFIHCAVELINIKFMFL